ncbi:MAG: HAD family phosphatase [bacterium]|nr:HAD family phosphatase [bacterium]
MKIKTIFFDIGNVLVAWDWTGCYAALARMSGKTIAELERIFWGNGEGDPEGIEHQYGRGLVTTDEFLRLMRERIPHGMTREQTERLWNGIFTPIPPMLALVERLKHAGLRLVIISNTNEMHLRHLRNVTPELARFDDVVLSYEVGALKPDDRIWEAALSTAAASPEECLFVDDYAANIEAFQQRFGVRGFVFAQDRFGAFAKFLKNHGARW